MYVSDGSDDGHGECGGFNPKAVRGRGGSVEEKFGLLAGLCEASRRRERQLIGVNDGVKQRSMREAYE